MESCCVSFPHCYVIALLSEHFPLPWMLTWAQLHVCTAVHDIMRHCWFGGLFFVPWMTSAEFTVVQLSWLVLFNSNVGRHALFGRALQRPSCLWVPHTVESSLLTTKRASKSHDGDLCRSLLTHLQVLPGSLAPTWSLSISQLTLQVRNLAAITTWFLRRPIGSWCTSSGLLLCPYLRIWQFQFKTLQNHYWRRGSWSLKMRLTWAIVTVACFTSNWTGYCKHGKVLRWMGRSLHLYDYEKKTIYCQQLCSGLALQLKMLKNLGTRAVLCFE